MTNTDDSFPSAPLPQNYSFLVGAEIPKYSTYARIGAQLSEMEVFLEKLSSSPFVNPKCTVGNLLADNSFLKPHDDDSLPQSFYEQAQSVLDYVNENDNPQNYQLTFKDICAQVKSQLSLNSLKLTITPTQADTFSNLLMFLDVCTRFLHLPKIADYLFLGITAVNIFLPSIAKNKE